MRTSFTIAAIGMAFAATVGTASAEESRAERTAVAAEVPWYERFTFSPSAGEAPPAWSSVNPRAPDTASAGSRWGITLDTGDQAGPVPLLRPYGDHQEAAIGAFYRFTPRVSVGGRVSVAPPAVSPGNAAASVPAEPDAGVRLESAFRF